MSSENKCSMKRGLLMSVGINMMLIVIALVYCLKETENVAPKSDVPAEAVSSAGLGEVKTRRRLQNGCYTSYAGCDEYLCDTTIDPLGKYCDCSDDYYCKVCNGNQGCSQCETQFGFFKMDSNYKCSNCDSVFGFGMCEHCSDFIGCQQCSAGLTRLYDEECGIYYCADCPDDIEINECPGNSTCIDTCRDIDGTPISETSWSTRICDYSNGIYYCLTYNNAHSEPIDPTKPLTFKQVNNPYSNDGSDLVNTSFVVQTYNGVSDDGFVYYGIYGQQLQLTAQLRSFGSFPYNKYIYGATPYGSQRDVDLSVRFSFIQNPLGCSDFDNRELVRGDACYKIISLLRPTYLDRFPRYADDDGSDCSAEYGCLLGRTFESKGRYFYFIATYRGN